VEIFEEVAVDGARMRPIEAIERFGRAEGGELDASSEVAGLALSRLDLAELLEELEGSELALGGVGEQGIDRIALRTHTELMESSDDVEISHGHTLRDRGE